MIHTKYSNHTDDELIREVAMTETMPRTDQRELLVELAARLSDALDELEDADELIEHAEADGQLQVELVTVQ